MVKVKNDEAESAMPSVEVMLMLIANSDIIRVDVMALQAEKGNTLDTLRNKNVWICDTGASTHVTWNSKCTRNVHEEHTMSLGHTGGAVEATAIIDIPGVFTSKDGEVGLKAVLQDCSFSKEHSFNVLSMSRLLHTQGWKITHGDKSLIQIENGKGRVINFDIVVPTAKGAVYACKFVQGVEIASACTATGVCININMAHCLLGSRNEDSIRKTAKEMG